MPAGRVHLSVDDARRLGERAMRGIGYDDEDARVLTDHVVDAALCGYEYSGLAKLLNVPEHRRFAVARQPIKLLRETEVSALYDGGNNNGMIALHHVAKAAIAKAQAHGIALVGVTNTWMSGRNAYFVEMIAKEGFVAIHTASSGGAVAPLGGIKPILGTNPIAFAIPTDEGPLILDMGTSAFMATELQLRVRRKEPLPEGVAIDRDGRPTTDPAEATAGALLPFAGYKGFGLGLVVQALGVLGGAGMVHDAGDGYLFIAFRPDLLIPLDQCKREVSALIARVKAVPRAPGVAEIRIPGENSARNRERLSREGLDIDQLVYDQLHRLAGNH
ncbi:MAG TPA: Ldh family oxidoreductase [Stellaceae bacterium]|jgi:LDH2 family malate/lactate/ureidoglycolate dehydrogenase|nr:Ldh family oxidoreductase [Stellaceae bacterium]